MFARLVSHTFFREKELTLLGPELGVVKLICLLDRIVKLLIELAWLDFVKLFAWLITAKLCLQFYETVHEFEWNIQLFLFNNE